VNDWSISLWVPVAPSNTPLFMMTEALRLSIVGRL